MTITDPTPTKAVATFDGSSGSMPVITGGHLPAFMEWSKAIAIGSVIPDSLRGKPADVLITVLHGLDLGLRPMQALNLVYVVKGRPSLSAEGMRALLLRDGHEYEVVESNDKTATVRGRRKGTETWHQASFTIEQAKRAKLQGANWEAYPEDMLLARATTRLCKRHFSDVTGGLPSTEEVLDATPEAQPLTLAQAAQARQDALTVNPETGEVLDDAAEAERLRQQVLALQEAATVTPDEPVEAELVNDNPDEAAPLWPEVAVPGGRK